MDACLSARIARPTSNGDGEVTICLPPIALCVLITLFSFPGSRASTCFFGSSSPLDHRTIARDTEHGVYEVSHDPDKCAVQSA
jgi:hypothetical protein